MNNSEILHTFITLRERLQNISDTEMEQISQTTFEHNLWFTQKNVRTSVQGIIALLEPNALQNWINTYQITEKKPKKIGVIMAGNIPFVGFHDVLCVLLTGNIVYAKLSSNDKILPMYVLNLLCKIAPKIKEKIVVADRLNDIDALIATGTDNSARYFEYYFSKIPRIVRKSRTSIAILDGTETKDELTVLGKDIFTYFGHGCRNVSCVLVPENYTFDTFFEAMLPYGEELLNNNKYCNNYDYHKAIYLMNIDKFLDNNFLMIRESSSIYSPISVLHYHRYENDIELNNFIVANKEKIQCIVAKKQNSLANIAFGSAQMPLISDYADGVDVMDFLENL